MIWDIDPAHSQVLFAIRVMGISTTRGRFKTLRGQLHVDEQHPANSWVEAEVEATSIDTHNSARDAHLRSGAFLAVKQYPTIAFKSTKVEQGDDSTYRVTGNLTLRGVTQPITFDVVSFGQRGQLGERAGLRASATINRSNFDVGRGVAVRFAASSTVSMEMEVEVVRHSVEVQEAAATTH